MAFPRVRRGWCPTGWLRLQWPTEAFRAQQLRCCAGQLQPGGMHVNLDLSCWLMILWIILPYTTVYVLGIIMINYIWESIFTTAHLKLGI